MKYYWLYIFLLVFNLTAVCASADGFVYLYPEVQSIPVELHWAEHATMFVADAGFNGMQSYAVYNFIVNDPLWMSLEATRQVLTGWMLGVPLLSAAWLSQRAQMARAHKYKELTNIPGVNRLDIILTGRREYTKVWVPGIGRYVPYLAKKILANGIAIVSSSRDLSGEPKARELISVPHPRNTFIELKLKEGDSLLPVPPVRLSIQDVINESRLPIDVAYQWYKILTDEIARDPMREYNVSIEAALLEQGQSAKILGPYAEGIGVYEFLGMTLSKQFEHAIPNFYRYAQSLVTHDMSHADHELKLKVKTKNKNARWMPSILKSVSQLMGDVCQKILK